MIKDQGISNSPFDILQQRGLTGHSLPSPVTEDRTKSYCVDIEHFIDPFAS